MSQTRFIAARSRRRCSSRGMPANRGHWSARWMPSNGGLFLHTIVPDPGNKERMYVAVSAGGVYRTENGGNTWQARNNGIRVVFMPEKYPEFGQCVHKIVLHESRPERLFLQNHWGLYRSDNRGDTAPSG